MNPLVGKVALIDYISYEICTSIRIYAQWDIEASTYTRKSSTFFKSKRENEYRVGE
jgi:hypothetical protein